MDNRFCFGVKLEILMVFFTVDVTGFLYHVSTAQTLRLLRCQAQDIVALLIESGLDGISNQEGFTVAVGYRLKFER